MTMRAVRVGEEPPPRLADLIDARSPGHTLPAGLYTRQDAFDLDIDVIFGRHWFFAGNEAEIPEPGDYFTVDVGAASVIVIRDDDERVRALRNVCRHRGSRVVDGPAGSVGNLVCPYHRWTYSPAGQLVYAEGQRSDFDGSACRLPEVSVRTVGGLILLCLATDPPDDVAEVAGTLEPYLAVHRLREAQVAARIDLVEHGNWKLVMENNRECYHCDGHPELTCSMFQLFAYTPDDVTPRLLPSYERSLAARDRLADLCAQHAIPTAPVEDLIDRPTGFQVRRTPLDGAGESFTDDGTRLCRRLLGDAPDFAFGHLSIHLQPNFWAHFLGDHAVTFSVLPLGPDRTWLRTTWLVAADAVAGDDYDVAELTRVWVATNEQDGRFVERTHRGVADPGYLPGPYSPTESHVDAFATWYVERIRAHGGGSR